MRLEQISAKALKYVGDDRYLLAKVVSQRSAELKNGATTKLNVDFKKYKYADLALMELAEGLINIDSITHEA